jgi:hypothetical protein
VPARSWLLKMPKRDRERSLRNGNRAMWGSKAANSSEPATNHKFATHNETQGFPSACQDRRPGESLVQVRRALPEMEGRMQGKRAGGR